MILILELFFFLGLVPPNQRSEEDFDPAAKFHVVADLSYVKYFTAFIYKFQFHKALCEAAGQYDPKDPNTSPLHECNLYGTYFIVPKKNIWLNVTAALEKNSS